MDSEHSSNTQENLFESSNQQQDDDLFGDSTSGDFSSFLGSDTGLENLSLNDNKESDSKDDGKKSSPIPTDTIQIVNDEPQVESLENTIDSHNSSLSATHNTDDDLFGTSNNEPFMKEIPLNENSTFSNVAETQLMPSTLPSVLSSKNQTLEKEDASSPPMHSPHLDTNSFGQQQDHHHEKTPPPLSSPPPPLLTTATSTSATSKPSVASNRGANRYVNSFGGSSGSSNAVFTPPSPHPTMTNSTTHHLSMNNPSSGGNMMNTTGNMPANMTNQAGLNNGMPPTTLNNMSSAATMPHQRMMSSPPPMMNTFQHNLTSNNSGMMPSTNMMTNNSGQFGNQNSMMNSTFNNNTGMNTRNMMTPPPLMGGGMTHPSSSFPNNSAQENYQFNNLPPSNTMNQQHQGTMYPSSYQQGRNSVSPTNLLNQSGAVMDGIATSRIMTGHASMNNSQFSSNNNSGMNMLNQSQYNTHMPPSSPQYGMTSSTFNTSYDPSTMMGGMTNNLQMHTNQFGMMNNPQQQQYPTMSMMMGMNNPQMMYHSQRAMSPSYQQNLLLSKQQLQQEYELRMKHPRPIFTFTFGGKIITSFPTAQRKAPLHTSANTFLAGNRSPTNFHGDQTSQESQGGFYYPGTVKVHKLSQVLRIACPMVKSLEDYPIGNISQQFDNDSNNSTILDHLIKYMNLKIYEKQQILFQQSDDQVVGEKMLWELIKIVAKNVNGNIGMISNDINALLTVLCSSSTTPMDDVVVTSSSTSVDVQPEQVIALQNMLINGQIKQACQYAQSNKMWTHAILLSSMVDKQTYQSVVSNFALSALNPGTPLRTLYCTFAGKPLDAFESNSIVSTDQYGNQYSSQSSQDQQQQIEKLCSQWIQNLSILFNNRQGKVSQAAIEKLGDVLWKDGYQVPQSHFCYVLGDIATLISAFAMTQPPSSLASPGRSTPQSQTQVNQQLITNMIASTSIVNRRVLLIAGDNKRDIRHYISDESMQLTEVFELLKSIMTRNILSSLQNDSQQIPPVSLLMNSTLLSYKLIYAYYLAEFGYLDKANECCDYLIDVVKKTQQNVRFGISFKLHLQELKLRIQESSKLTGAPVSSLSASSKKQTSGGGVTGWFMRGLESIIHGTDSEESSPTANLSQPMGHSMSMPNIAVNNNNGGIMMAMPGMGSMTSSHLHHQPNNTMLHTRPASYTPPPTQSHTLTPPPPSLHQTSQTPPPPSSHADQNASNNSGSSGVSSWFKGWWGGSSSKSSSGKKEANIGRKNEFYYDEDKKRWVRKGQENEVVEQVTAPPPTLASIPSNNLQSAASQLRGGASRYVNMFSGGGHPHAGMNTSSMTMPSSSSTPPPMMMSHSSTPPPPSMSMSTTFTNSYFMPQHTPTTTGGGYEMPSTTTDFSMSIPPPSTSSTSTVGMTSSQPPPPTSNMY
ncbi:hypothetical protein C9374_010248 [Naegleria lovaniensis]|uniref:Protein transport protein sec16 n=1 Tax=Naegleria lovaniensis TaxID=51637 RepID=A0AA88GGI8_NAELO|nr:uncharacterized protein C9374_010248 [Naegleria lovaniensis]KAG2374874.1 hypothetical protein C9374_010248 [Naegleria lovaniensis]